ncbi:MAG: response regulator transcription factor [Gemmatimonadota bacterium]|nr:response regulator transcription factor [Gemmatimonadota bacterium]
MKRILIADDHAVVREGIRRILEAAPEISVEGEVGDARELVRLVRSETWDAVLLDISMPGGDVLDTLARIRELAPDLPVLVLSMHPEDQFAVRLIRAGATGYLTKDAAPERLVTALRRVLQGGRYIGPDLAEVLAGALDGGDVVLPHERLSDRELTVLRLIAAGRTPSEIAATLHLSPKTVSTYRSRLLEKLDMRTDAEVARYAVEHGLVP